MTPDLDTALTAIDAALHEPTCRHCEQCLVGSPSELWPGSGSPVHAQ